MGSFRWGVLFALFFLVITPSVAKDKESEEPEMLRVIVDLEGQVDLNSLPQSFKSHEKRTKYIYRKLKRYNDRKIRPLLKALKPHKAKIEELTPMPIINAARLVAPKSVIDALQESNRFKIAVEQAKEISELGQAEASFGRAHPENTEISWGVEKLRAPELWKIGIQGQGILVALVDTGANYKHLDLAPNIWLNPGENGKDQEGRKKSRNGIDDDGNGYVDDFMGWNFQKKNNDVSDSWGHGSKAGGILAGAGTQGTQTGVAKKATMMVVRTCCGDATSIFESNTMLGLQYALQHSARVISMSLSVKYYAKPSHAKWRRISEVMLAADIVHVNSAGNLGSDAVPKNVGAPCSNPPAWLHPDQPQNGGKTSMITVGATDRNDKLRDYSSTGPVTWENVSGYGDYPFEAGKHPGLIKPDVCGPSEMPSTSNIGNDYVASFGGTSSATPAIAGVVALLLSSRPDLSVAQVTEALQMSTVHVDGNFTNHCGSGRVDAMSAMTYIHRWF